MGRLTQGKGDESTRESRRWVEGEGKPRATVRRRKASDQRGSKLRIVDEKERQMGFAWLPVNGIAPLINKPKWRTVNSRLLNKGFGRGSAACGPVGRVPLTQGKESEGTKELRRWVDGRLAVTHWEGNLESVRRRKGKRPKAQQT